jgi:hypothetical protein
LIPLAVLSQRQIYDERFAQPGYDRRSAIRVLKAESALLNRAVSLAVKASGTDPVTVLDFGHGTGRVLDHLVSSWRDTFGKDGRVLHLTAYDVSSVGLEKSAWSLSDEAGLKGLAKLCWRPGSEHGYAVGDLVSDGGDIRVRYVHGNEGGSADSVRNLLLEAADHRPYLVTTSWYSAIGHITEAARRRLFFDMLAQLTDDRGEFVVAVSALGDLVDAQNRSRDALPEGKLDGLSIECSQDVVYTTELGQQNFWHVFGPDLQTLLKDAFHGGRSWLEAVRFPDDEFESVDAEEENYRRVQNFNAHKGEGLWCENDFMGLHMVAAVHSGTLVDGSGVEGSGTYGSGNQRIGGSRRAPVTDVVALGAPLATRV